MEQKNYMKMLIEALSSDKKVLKEYTDDEINDRYKKKPTRFHWMDEIGDIVDRVSEINKSTKSPDTRQIIDNAVKKFYKDNDKFAVNRIIQTINWATKNRPHEGMAEQFKDVYDDLHDIIHSDQSQGSWYEDIEPHQRGPLYKNVPAPPNIRKPRFNSAKLKKKVD